MSNLLEAVKSVLEETSPAPIRIGRVIPRVEVKYPVIALSYEGTEQRGDWLAHRVRVTLYVRVPYLKVEDAETMLCNFANWILKNKELVILVDGTFQSAFFEIGTSEPRVYLDDAAYALMELSYVLKIPHV